MLTYLIIGLIVQAVILIERAIRLSGYWDLLDFKDWRTWVGLLYGITVNTVLWPLTIIMEIWLVIHGI